MEKIVSLCKRRGFIFQGSEIYGGLAGTFDYGPLGVELKNNIKALWWKRFIHDRNDMYGVDAAILMNPKVWVASGHVSGFSDPLVACTKCKHRFRADQLDDAKKCPDCGGALGDVKQFNMMFKTAIGADDDSSSDVYLRPETAGGMFVNFKNVMDSLHPKLPFGLGQIGKAFRNEIAPRDFLFRVREFEQMEVEYFVAPEYWEAAFEDWRKQMLAWTAEIGLKSEHVHEHEIAPEDLAFYSKRTIDFEFDYPFGQKELYGLAYRTDYDLGAHAEHSSVDLSYFDEEAKKRFIPHVIEPSLGVDRTVLAVLCDAYREEPVEDDVRVVLGLPAAIAPYQVAVLPLMKKDGLSEKAQEIYKELSKSARVLYDESGSIGKRYRRQDEIGTPVCVTVDHQTLEDGTLTIRDRDTMKQERVSAGDLLSHISIS
ncbi:glycine--tRNA ligase [Candidatus Campbellbacteria bacterium]|nr:MAG: glycine--tRNA ligase [Candidatus Campbellbacteria bacterium]